MKARLVLLLIAASLVAIGAWSIRNRGRRLAPPAVAPTHKTSRTVPIQDGKTLDFSSGNAVVKNTAADQTALAKGVAEMNAAAAEVQFAAPAKPQP